MFKFTRRFINAIKDATPSKTLLPHKGTNAQNFHSKAMCESIKEITQDMVSVSLEDLANPRRCPYTGLLRE